ncbi:CTP synthase [Iodobacter sp. CM08]|uniref:CTP synthase C-terminal region-related (seleno)protein n=1 Tax=Iodobacter sp. CM08 TaxID=3085902 RepID=UPI0029810A2E|nr:CTP synthase [Iodobacter sp. CM08]MDW5416935.1 CTP synthase [Iodobacter sp. CM08]
MKISIALIGDYNAEVIAHQAIPLALELAAQALDIEIQASWLPTEQISSKDFLSPFDGLWCVPASPYKNTDGALLAIRYAREQNIPFLGTCGGFQHAVIEYARNVLGWADADHAETAPDAQRAVISPLECSLVEANASVRFMAGSKLAEAYQNQSSTEGYRCRYGLNPEFQAALTTGPLRATAMDEAGDIRGIELDDHPFFVATLFQPERKALTGVCPPIVKAFITAIQ